MFDNILFGPICCYQDNKHREQIIKELSNENWIPLYSITKGTWLEQIKMNIDPQQAKLTKGIMITIGFRKLYQA